MTLKSLMLAGAGLILMTLPTRAFEPRYAGEVLCDDIALFVSLTVAPDGQAVLAERPRNLSVFIERTEGVLVRTDDIVKLMRGDQPVKLSGRVRSEDGALEAVWIEPGGAAKNTCDPVILLPQTRSVAEHYAALMTALSVAEPDLDAATTAAALMQLRPEPSHVAEVERQSLTDSLDAASRQFWWRFWRAELARQEAMPVTDASTLAALATRIAAVSRDGMAPGDSVVQEPFFFIDTDEADLGEARHIESGLVQRRMARRLADRAAAIGLTPQPILPDVSRRGCRRLHDGGTASSINSIEMRFMLPADYWNEAAITAMRERLVACAGIAGFYERHYAHMLSLLDNEKAEIARRIEARTWLTAERDRLLALPRTLDTLIATNGYAMSEDAMRERDITKAERARFGAAQIDQARSEALAAAQQQISAAFANAKPATESEAVAAALCERAQPIFDLNEACRAARAAYVDRVVNAHVDATLATIQAATRDVAGLRATDGYHLRPLRSEHFGDEFRDRLREREWAFEAVAGPLRDEALTTAKSEIAAAFAAAEPGTPSEAAAQRLCQRDPGFVSSSATDVLAPLCAEALQAYEIQREQRICDTALAAAKLSPGDLERRIAWPGLLQQNAVLARDFICQLAQMAIRVQFEDTSGWFSSGMRVTLSPRTETPGAKPVAIDYIKSSDQRGEVWTPKSIKTVDGTAVGGDSVLTCVLSGVC